MTREEFVQWIRDNKPEPEDYESLEGADGEIAEVREHDPVLADKMQAVVSAGADLLAYFKEIGPKYESESGDSS